MNTFGFLRRRDSRKMSFHQRRCARRDHRLRYQRLRCWPAGVRRASLAIVLLLWPACSEEPPVQWAHGPRNLPVGWKSLSASITIASPPTGTLRWSEVHAGMLHALETWNVASEIQLVGGGQLGVSEDGVNAVVVASTREARLAKIDRDAHAQTQLYTRSVEGTAYAEIVEADIAIPLSVLDASQPVREQQLRALLVHEFGHYLGLDHSCGARLSGGPPLDACDADSRHRAQAMYPDALEGVPLRPSKAELAAVRERYGLE